MMIANGTKNIYAQFNLLCFAVRAYVFLSVSSFAFSVRLVGPFSEFVCYVHLDWRRRRRRSRRRRQYFDDNAFNTLNENKSIYVSVPVTAVRDEAFARLQVHFDSFLSLSLAFAFALED